tara:strand:- start:129 stop:530 length:402 start_codon:yes stop_codon:yes gene_type:complete
MIKDFGIYQVHNEHGELMYIGSTEKTLSKVEYNHREETHFWNPKTKKKDIPIGNIDPGSFRYELREQGQYWIFSWLQEPRKTTNFTILIEEGACIRALNPKLNKKTEWGQYPLKPRLQRGKPGFIKQDERVYL